MNRELAHLIDHDGSVELRRTVASPRFQVVPDREPVEGRMTHWREHRQARSGGNQPAGSLRGELIRFPHNSLLTARPPLEGGDVGETARNIIALCFFLLALCSVAALFGLLMFLIVFIWG